jgi:DNA-binding response OmpR family regulator
VPLPAAGERQVDAPWGGRILLVGTADPALGLVADALVARGHAVQPVEELAPAVRLARSRAPAVIVVGALGTAGDVLEAIQALRLAAASPIMAIAQRETSAADYLVLHLRGGSHDLEVLSLPQLTQRIEVASRGIDSSERPFADVEEIGGLRIDRQARQVHLGGTELRLSAREFDLLSFLAAHAGRVHSPETLLEQVWRHTAANRREVKTVAVHVRWMREKLLPQQEVQIVTVRGSGYRLDGPRVI